MKLSAIIVSVNIAATIPLMVQAAAQAQSGAVSDRADWLNSSLASMDRSPNRPKKPGRKASMSIPRSSPSLCMTSNGVRLRPFVPGRKLPRQNDPGAALVTQTPQMASMQPAMPLTARVSEYSLGQSGGTIESPGQKCLKSPNSCRVATYDSPSYFKDTSRRVMPNQVIATPGQIAPSRKYPAAPSIDRLNGGSERHTQPPSGLECKLSPLQQFKAAGPDPTLLCQAPIITPDEQATMDRMVDAARPHTFTGTGDDQEGTSVTQGDPPAPDPGPAPFPLCLIPQDQLRQFVGRRRPHIDAPPSYFGSWHTAGTPTACVPTKLPPCGFQSYITGRGSNSTNFTHYAPRVGRAFLRNLSRPLPAMRNLTPLKIAVYPSYYTAPHTVAF